MRFDGPSDAVRHGVRTKGRDDVASELLARPPARLNEIWALDFMADALDDGRGFRTFNVIDEGNGPSARSGRR